MTNRHPQKINKVCDQRQSNRTYEVKGNRAAAYSYQELMTVYHYLVNNVYSLKGISSVSLSNKGNCIDIGISSDSHWSELQKDLLMMIQTNTDVKNITDNSILSFHTVKPEDEFSYAVSINGPNPD